LVLTSRAVDPQEDLHDTDEHHDIDDHHKEGHRPEDPDISTSHDHYDKTGHHDESFDHDSVTGSHHESEEFKDLEPDEAKRRLGLLVDRMDSNRDMTVNKTELYNWIMTSFKNLDIEDSTSKMQDIDNNNDKAISWNEFVTKTYGHNEKEVEDMIKNKNPDMKSFLEGISLDKQKFQLADRNKDGKMDIHEYTLFSHPHNYQEMASYELARTLEDFDKNKDGKIDLKEFIGDHDKMDNATLEHEKSSFKGFDKDKNGLLEGHEISDWTMPGFEKSALIEVEHLFNETDVNKDGLLSKDEVINQHELWVGSHATDYGKHLDDMKPHEEL